MVDIDNIVPCALLSSTCKLSTEGKAVTGMADWPGTAKQIHCDVTGLKSWEEGMSLLELVSEIYLII